MSKKRTRTCCLVLDASIARAASAPEAADPMGTACRDFLIALRGVCHRIAWSRAIKAEWDKHQSLFAGEWLVSMMALKKLRTIPDEGSAELRAAIEHHSDDRNVVAIMVKDAHLVEAALVTDLRIASRDDNARGHFGRLAARYVPLRRVVWVNPSLAEEQAIDWLEGGAPTERSRRLRP